MAAAASDRDVASWSGASGNGTDASWINASWIDAQPGSFWLDQAGAPEARTVLAGDTECDLAIVGGGYSGLWTAILAKERDPNRDVLLLEAEKVAGAASGRNGGFCSASLTHGEPNGRDRFAGEYDRLHDLGLQNLAEIEKTVVRYGIDCDFARTGDLTVATEAHQVSWLRESGSEFLDTDAIRQQLNSATYLAGCWDHDGTALVDPARLGWGLAAVAERLGVRVHDGSPVTALSRSGAGIALVTANGSVQARQVALATNAFRPLLKRLRLFTVPVYDYVLMSEPLTVEQLASIGWANRQGVSDSGNQFHYYRLSADNRILWGGYDAIYHFGRRVERAYDQRPATYAALARNFFRTFPQLEGLRFSHRWGGAIDTCTRFCAFYGTAMRGQVAYALGYTGLGVGATRFGANVMLDLLSGVQTERTELDMVRSKPLPFPPEPFAYAGVEITRRSLARADDNAGRRNLWLRTLDRAGLGFDS
jgi:glycine/D-amino acid oxidase-like deaminating enzyme